MNELSELAGALWDKLQDEFAQSVSHGPRWIAISKVELVPIELTEDELREATESDEPAPTLRLTLHYKGSSQIDL